MPSVKLRGMRLLVVLVAYLDLCSANARQQWPQPPLRRTRHHCNACFLDETPRETCDFQLKRTCTEKAGCLRPDARCLEAPYADYHMRCCCLPENGVTSTSLCGVVGFLNMPLRFNHCILKCCEHHNCGNGCAAKEEGCGDALPPFEGPCRIVANATAAQQTNANCCLWSKGVSCTSSQQEPCCLEAAVHPGQVCQPTQAACMIKPTPLPASGSGLLLPVCMVVVLVLVGLVAAVVMPCSRRQPGHAGRERLLREAGPAVSLVEVPAASKRCVVVISCGKFTGGSPSLDAIDSAHDQGSRVCKLFQDELGFDVVQHEQDVPTTAAFWQMVARLLRDLDGEPHVLLVLYFITHGVEHDCNLRMAMSAAAPLVLDDEWYLTKVDLQHRFQTIDNSSEAQRLHNCKPLAYMNLVIFADTCRRPPPQEARTASRGIPHWPKACHLQKRDKPARICFVHACEYHRPALGHFTEAFLQLARVPQSLDALIDSMREELEKSTGKGRQQRVCCDSGSLNLKDVYLHPASGLPSSSSTILGPTGSEGPISEVSACS
ncbi:unnamed protein product [Symbiodinium sp. KB8]|nr:unnamed protein product [Symbiodinium sp. KB8]